MIRQFEMALAIDRHRSFQHAAEALGVSQSSLTRGLQALEGELGVRLFERGKAECEPTIYGRVVLERARRVLGELAEARRELDLLRGLRAGEFVVGMGPTLVEQWVGGAIGELSAANPGLRIATRQYHWYEMAEALISGEVDVAVSQAVASHGKSEIAVAHLPVRSCRLFCRIDHPLTRRSTVALEDIAHYPLAAPLIPARIGQYLPAVSALGAMSADGRYFRPAVQCSSWTAAREIVRHSDAISFHLGNVLAGPENRDSIAVLEFDSAWLRSEPAVMWRRDRMEHPALKAFRDAVWRGEAAANGGRGADKGSLHAVARDASRNRVRRALTGRRTT